MTVMATTSTYTQRCAQQVLQVTEALDAGSFQQFWSDLEAAAARRPERLVVDLSRCPYLDAQAIRLLLDIHQLIWIQDGRLVLRGARPPVTRLLELAGVTNVFVLENELAEQVSR